MRLTLIIATLVLSGCATERHNNCQGPIAVFKPWPCRDIAIRYKSRNRLIWKPPYDYERDVLTK